MIVMTNPPRKRRVLFFATLQDNGKRACHDGSQSLKRRRFQPCGTFHRSLDRHLSQERRVEILCRLALSTFTAQIFEAFIDDENEIILVSDNSDGIAGFVRVTLESPAPIENGPETEIATLYVQPRHTGKGIGRRLLDEAFRLRAERGRDGVWLAVNSENQDAIAFYQRLGFTRDGQTTFRIGEQSYANAVMVKRL